MKTIKNFDKFLNESINDKLDISDVLYKLKHGDILKSKSISDTGIAHQFKLKDDENIYKIYFNDETPVITCGRNIDNRVELTIDIFNKICDILNNFEDSEW